MRLTLHFFAKPSGNTPATENLKTPNYSKIHENESQFLH